MRLPIVLAIAMSRVAVAAPPSGYSCGQGKPLVGTGCQCPANQAPARDGENTAICIVKSQPPPPDPAPTTAQQAFEQAEKWYAQLQKLPALRGTAKDLQEQMRVMVKVTRDLESRYDKVMSFNDPSWGLSAAVRRGDINEWIAVWLRSAPIPSDIRKLGDEAADQYQIQIENIIDPIEKRAVEAWKTALDKAKAAGIWNDHLAHARERMSNYDPDHYPPQHALRIPTSTTMDPADAGRWNDVAAKFLASQAFADAKEAAEKSLTKTPGFVKAQINLGSALRGLDKWAEAEASYKAAIAKDANATDAHYDLVILYLDQKLQPTEDKLAALQKARAAATELKRLDPSADKLLGEIDRAVAREQRRREREQKAKKP